MTMGALGRDLGRPESRTWERACELDQVKLRPAEFDDSLPFIYVKANLGLCHRDLLAKQRVAPGPSLDTLIGSQQAFFVVGPSMS